MCIAVNVIFFQNVYSTREHPGERLRHKCVHVCADAIKDPADKFEGMKRRKTKKENENTKITKLQFSHVPIVMLLHEYTVRESILYVLQRELQDEGSCVHVYTKF